ncbi:MAG: hypothetical protein ABWK00_06995 [Desulfurococcaceae archaeon]
MRCPDVEVLLCTYHEFRGPYPRHFSSDYVTCSRLARMAPHEVERAFGEGILGDLEREGEVLITDGEVIAKLLGRRPERNEYVVLRAC